MATSNTAVSRSLLFDEPREDWLALRQEDVIDPERPIVDAHHHLWDRGGQHYMIEEIVDDIASGHNIIATVYVDCRSMYRAHGPEAFRPVGEVEFANGVAAMSENCPPIAWSCRSVAAITPKSLPDRVATTERTGVGRSGPGCVCLHPHRRY